jgi:ABC-2 type transport system permease protein
VLEGSRTALLEGAEMSELWQYIWPTLLLALIAVPGGLRIFGMAERYAKRKGKLARNG